MDEDKVSLNHKQAGPVLDPSHGLTSKGVRDSTYLFSSVFSSYIPTYSLIDRSIQSLSTDRAIVSLGFVTCILASKSRTFQKTTSFCSTEQSLFMFIP